MKFCLGLLDISGLDTYSKNPSWFGHLSSLEKDVQILPPGFKTLSKKLTADLSSAEWTVCVAICLSMCSFCFM